MNEVEPGRTAATPDAPIADPARVGDRLRGAREALGLTLAEVAERTRVPLRHLEAIEATDFAALPSPTYAVGFSRAYARAVGLNEVTVAGEVRAELAKVERPPEYEPYETADPARVPSRGVAILGLGLAVAILVLVGLWYGTDLFRGGFVLPGGSGSVADSTAIPAAAPPATVTPPAAPTPATARQVTLTAGKSEVWMRVYDADNKTLYLGTLAPGETFDVPPTANRPMINVGRPDTLQVTVDGRAVPALGTGERPIKDVPIDAAAMAVRASGQPQPQPQPAATAASSTGSSEERAARPAPRPRPRPSSTPALTETQRANLNAAVSPPPATNTTATE